MTRIIRSAISGRESTSQGNLERMAKAGFKAPTESNAARRPTFWLMSFGSGTFFDSTRLGALALGWEAADDSRGAAIANWLVLAPDILAFTSAKYSS
jgi:hypothetical protein